MKPSTGAESIDWGTVAVVGEYTVPSGPDFDDHFLVIILRSGRVLECPTDRAESVIPMVENAIKTKIEFQLCNRADTASRVLFPPELAEQPLFKFSETPRPKGLLRFLSAIKSFGLTEISKHLTQELADYIGKKGTGTRRP